MLTYTAADLQGLTFRAPTAADLVDLIDSGACTPQCLFGLPGATCHCRCGERYHGDARQPSSRVPRPVTCDCLIGVPLDGIDQSRAMFMRPRRWTAADGIYTTTYECESCGLSATWSWNYGQLIAVEEADLWAAQSVGEFRAESASRRRARERASG